MILRGNVRRRWLADETDSIYRRESGGRAAFSCSYRAVINAFFQYRPPNDAIVIGNTLRVRSRGISGRRKRRGAEAVDENNGRLAGISHEMTSESREFTGFFKLGPWGQYADVRADIELTPGVCVRTLPAKSRQL
jgi:hypothetical protein